jgi:arylsulfatase A
MFREFPGLALPAVLCALCVSCATADPAGDSTGPSRELRPPNVIVILADDLGYGELGCYGQQRIRTPHLDQLAARGMRFTQAYSGAPVCAPARCVLLTGRHSARAEIRGNREVQPEGQHPLTAESPSIAHLMRSAGYATGAMGKWGLGPVGSTGDPNAQGFDLFYGYNCQRQAHSYYPDHLWRNGQRMELNGGVAVPGHGKLEADTLDEPDGTGEMDTRGFERFRGADYAPDLILDAAMGFLREHREEPFFLYLPFVEPHVAMQPPQQWVDRYPDEWDTEPYLGQRGYVPHPRPRAGYAAMISDLDEHVGKVMALLDELGLTNDTLVLFTSDNGATHDVGGVDTEFFRSVGPLRGRKGSVYEGGLRVPMIAHWPGVIAPGSSTDHPTAFQDLMATLADLTGTEAPGSCDGISFLPTLRGLSDQPGHEALVWEFWGYGGQKAVRLGDWKAVLREIHKGNQAIELYDLSVDIGEAHDVAAQHPEIVARARQIFATDRIASEVFPMQAFD